MNNPGHIQATVGSTIYPFVIDPLSYSEVDVTDFAPRAVGSNVSLGELGLYTDAGQIDFGHGYGEMEFVEQQSYAYSGQYIDTRHGHIQLFSKATNITGLVASTAIRRIILHRNVPFVLYADRLAALDTSGSVIQYSGSQATFGGDTAYDVISTSKYMIVSNSGRLRVCDGGKVTSATSNTMTVASAGWYTDVWAGGKVYIIGGADAGDSGTITGNTATAITISGTFATALDTTSVYLLVAPTGNASNQATNFGKMTIFGGYYWAIERGTNYVHFWAEERASDAEGNGTADIAAIQVGPIGTPLNDLLGYDNQLYVFREDGAWAVHQDNLSYQTGLMFQAEQSSLNFKGALVWQGFLIFPIRNTLYKFRSGLQDITPPIWDDNLPFKMFGDYRGIMVRGRFMYALGQSNAANSDESATEGTAGFISLLATDGVGWHKVLDVPFTSIPSEYDMWLDPVNDYLYIYGLNASGNPEVWYVQFEELSDYPEAAAYPTGTFYNLYTSWFTFNMPRIPKSFASVTIGGFYPTNTSIQVSYRVTDGAAWTVLGTSSTDMEELDFPAGTTGKKIQLKIGLKTTSASATPVVKKIILKLMLRPDVLYGVSCDVIVSDDLSDPNRLVGRMTAKEIRAGLKACRSSVAPITLQDIHGDSASAYLSSVRFLTVAYEDMDAVQQIARCTFVYV